MATIQPTERQEVTYLGRPAVVWEYHAAGGGRFPLRVAVKQWKDTGEMHAKVLEGDGRKRTCTLHVPDRPVTEAELDALVAEWIG